MAFARVVGVGGSSLGLNAAQLRQLADANGFPAAYQLFPPAHLEPLWKLDDPVPFKGVSVFDPAVAANYRLVDAHLRATRALHERLDPSRRPPGCRYFSIVSAAHETVTRLDEDAGSAVVVKVKSAGDGTVPIASATALRVQTAFVEANHVGVAQKALTHRMIGMLLGALPVEPLPMAFDIDPTSVSPSLNLSLNERTIGAGESYEIVVTTTPQDAIGLCIRITKQSPDGSEPVQEIPVVIQGPSIERVALRGPDLPPGQYRFDLVAGDAGDDAPDRSEELLVTGENDA